jgi:hypothetical protein
MTVTAPKFAADTGLFEVDRDSVAGSPGPLTRCRPSRADGGRGRAGNRRDPPWPPPTTPPTGLPRPVRPGGSACGWWSSTWAPSTPQRSATAWIAKEKLRDLIRLRTTFTGSTPAPSHIRHAPDRLLLLVRRPRRHPRDRHPGHNDRPVVGWHHRSDPARRLQRQKRRPEPSRRTPSPQSLRFPQPAHPPGPGSSRLCPQPCPQPCPRPCPRPCDGERSRWPQ